MDIIFQIYKPILSWAARKTVIGRNRNQDNSSEGRFTKQDVDQLLSSTWKNYRSMVKKIPEEKKAGAQMNVRLAALSYAFFLAFVSTGISQEHAANLIADVAWKVYDRWAGIPILLAKILPGRPSLERYVQLFLRFPFNPPGYESQVWLEEGKIHTNFTRCPVALFMQKVGAADLCLHTWCQWEVFTQPHACRRGYRV